MSGGRETAAALRLLRAADGDDQARVFRALPEAMRRALAEAWTLWAHDGQLPPEGEDAEWAVWLIRAGRGFGKTRAGAEWVQAYARANVAARIALVGGNAEDVRQVMIEGPSGLIATVRHGERWSWKRDRGEFVFDSGVDVPELRLAPGDTGATVRQRGTWAESPPANLWWGDDR